MSAWSRLWGRQSSGSVAKERLQLVLVHDRASVAPDMLEALKNDLIAVISRYMDIDHAGTEVNLEHDGGTTALVASIPVLRMRRRQSPMR